MAAGWENAGEMQVADARRLRQCVHCGLCLEACPTYVLLGTEMDSPRGRIYLIAALQEGTLSLSADVVDHLDLCLGCRACEPACPSGVKYGSIIEETRAYVEENFERSWWKRLERRLILSVFPYRPRLRALLSAARLARRLGVLRIVQRLAPVVTVVAKRRPPRPLAQLTPASGVERARVGLLCGCVGSELFGGTNEATVRVLSANGVSVVVPPGQACCGALHLHAGAPHRARELARRNVDSFPEDLDAIVVNAAGCGAAMKQYGALLSADPVYAERARRFASRVRDVTEYLGQMPVRAPTGALPMRVVYHDACHLAHGQGICDQPRELLRRIPGVELVALPESDLCCGSAGTYSLTEPRMARRLGERKIDSIARTGASCVAVANPGCALQIEAGLRARGLQVRVAHPVELLDESYAVSAGRARGGQ